MISNSVSEYHLNYATSAVTLDPKSQPAPWGLAAHVSISSGSTKRTLMRNFTVPFNDPYSQ